MQAFLITPDHEAQTVKIESIVLPDDGAVGCYQHLGELLEADFPERVVPRAREFKDHVAFVDDNGLSKAPPGHILAPGVHPLPLAGKIILTGETFDPMDGPIPVSATVTEATVLQIFANSYVTRAYAKAAHDLSETTQKIAHRDNPSMTVLTPSKNM